MANEDLQAKLVEYLEDAHAMERNVHQMLKSMISTTDDPEIKHELEHHLEETERHEQLVKERLDALGAGKSTAKEMGGVVAAMFKAPVDKARGDKPAKNARDGFATEHVEIAAYQLLERVAERAGDEATVEVARRNRADEEAMAEKIASNWDKFVTLTLAEEGVAA